MVSVLIWQKNMLQEFAGFISSDSYGSKFTFWTFKLMLLIHAAPDISPLPDTSVKTQTHQPLMYFSGPAVTMPDR